MREEEGKRSSCFLRVADCRKAQYRSKGDLRARGKETVSDFFSGNRREAVPPLGLEMCEERFGRAALDGAL
jgi:hypothetical protein